MTKNTNSSNKSNKTTIIVSAILFVITIMSITFAYFSPATTGDSYELTGNANAEVANISFSGPGGYTLTKSYPMIDADGINAAEPYDFSITNNETESTATIYVILETLNTNTLSNSLINFNLAQKKNNTEELFNFTKTLTDNESITPLTTNYNKAYKIYTTTIPAGETANFSLKAWINDKGTVNNAQNKTWTSKIVVRGYKREYSADATLAALGLTASNADIDFNVQSPEKANTYTDNGFDSSETCIDSSAFTNRTYTIANIYDFDIGSGTYDLKSPWTNNYNSSLVGKYTTSYTGYNGTAIQEYQNLTKIYKITSVTTDEICYIASSKTANSIISEFNSGIFTAEDDYGTSYYFRGAVENNYVKFAGFYWRIIRINGDGSLRIIYDGTTAHKNGESSADRIVSTSAFNTSKDDNAYVGYMYGLAGTVADANRCLILENDTVTNKISTYSSESACTSAGGKWTETAYEATHANVKDSTIKVNLDTWYKTNIVDKGYSSAVSDTLFCNDRSLSSGTGTGTSTSYYNSYNRLTKNKNPSLKCAQQNDSFTVSDTVKGNGDLTYPVGLITADEASLAGGKDGISNSNYYLSKGSLYWSASPDSYNSYASSWYVYSYGDLIQYGVNYTYGLVPVINLTPETAMELTGSGTMTEPYKVEEYKGASPERTLAALKLTDKVNEGTPDFNTIATTDEGIFAQEDDYGTSYYFRGAVENNYVKFAGFYWRIIRINGDGSLRIIYDGTKAHKNGESSTDSRVSTSVFNTSSKDNAYVGYMYGLAGTTTDANRCLILENDTVVDKVSTYTSESACTSAGGMWTETAYEATHANVKSSTIKGNLDVWYKTNIVDKGYSSAVSDTLFCNDRSLSSGTGTGTTRSYYNANDRLYTNKNPNLKCSQQNDAFTVSDTVNGNGDLTYPVGLITADEVALAGNVGDVINDQFYLYSGSGGDKYFWTMSPYYSSYDTSYMFINTKFVNISWYTISDSKGMKPVINLTADYCLQLKGSGTTTDPYTAS